MLRRLENHTRHSPLGHLNRNADNYLDVLSTQPIRKVRNLVTACRLSGQCRQQFAEILRRGNEDKTWGEELLPEVQLLRDCKTHWSSTHDMIGRVLLLYPVSESLLLGNNWYQAVAQVIHCFLNHPRNIAIANHLLTEDELTVLNDVYNILHVPHATQEVLSAEKTPTLSMALPAYELMLNSWRHQQRAYPQLASVIGIGIDKIEEYMMHTRKTRAYALSMSVYCFLHRVLFERCHSSQSINEISMVAVALGTE